MKDAFLIAATLDLQGNADKALARIVANFEKAGKQSDFLKENLKKLGVVLDALAPSFDTFSNSIKESNAAMRTMNNAFTSFNARLESAGYRMDTVTEKAERLKAAVAGVGEAVTASNVMMAPGRASGGHGGGRRHSSIHAKPFHFGVFGFSAPTIAAAAVGYGAYESIKQDAVYQQILSQIMLQNIPGTSESQINSFINSKNIPGVSKIDLLQKLQDSLVVSKNIKEAEGIAPFLGEIGYGNKALFKGTNQELSHNDFYAMVKSAELITGSMDVNKLKPVIDEQVKINSATSGQVKPTEYLQMLQKTRGSLRGADPGIFYQLEPIVQEYRGAATGVMVRALYQHLQAGRLTTAASLQLEKMGLIKPGFAEFNKIGMIKRVRPGGIVDQDLLNKDFIDWYNKYFISYFQKNKLTPNQEKMINSVIFTNSDLALVNALTQQQSKIAKTAQLNAHAAGTQQLVAQASGLLTGQVAQFNAAASSLGVSFGKLLMPEAIAGMKALTWLINEVTNLDATIGHTVYDKLHAPAVQAWATPHKNDFAPDWLTHYLSGLKHPANAVPAASHQAIHITTIAQLDGKELYRSNTKHQSNEMSRTMQTGTNYPDANMSLPWLGWNGR
jgi:hypothetical protein